MSLIIASNKKLEKKGVSFYYSLGCSKNSIISLDDRKQSIWKGKKKKNKEEKIKKTCPKKRRPNAHNRCQEGYERKLNKDNQPCCYKIIKKKVKAGPSQKPKLVLNKKTNASFY